MLEAIVQNLEDAIEAERVGIDRLELVSCIERDGLTPSLKTTKEIIEHVKIPRSGDDSFTCSRLLL
ncbi:copper homeostasis protein CutC [Gracilibacillus sp. JCM 18860]|uniref:copper homeostasis protein CutC n=1 Tax=Gracilibacillus sp. JCM 18860 TaxID=1306159 RepID=UPI0006D174FC